MVLTYEINLFKDQEILKRFKTNETNFSVVQGKISALITEAELIELQGGGVTMYNRLGKAEMNIRGLYLNFSDLSTKYNSITGQYEQYDAKLADFEFSLDGFRSELSETHTTITNTSNRVNGLSQTLANDYWTSTTTTTKMNAAIKQAIDEISLSVSKTYVTSTTYNSGLNGKNKTFRQANAPTTGMITGDLWIDSDDNVLYRYNGSSWLKVQDNAIESLKTRVNSAELKITDSAIVSTVRSSTLYKSDLNGKVSSSSIISAINQSAESILISASKINLSGYVTISSLGSSGATTVNGNRISGGTISLGGASNGNGALKIYNASGTLIGSWDNSGIRATTGTFSGTISQTGASNTHLTIQNAEISGGYTNRRTNSIDLSNGVKDGNTWYSNLAIVGGDYIELRSPYLYVSHTDANGNLIEGDHSAALTYARLNVKITGGSYQHGVVTTYLTASEITRQLVFRNGILVDVTSP